MLLSLEHDQDAASAIREARRGLFHAGPVSRTHAQDSDKTGRTRAPLGCILQNCELLRPAAWCANKARPGYSKLRDTPGAARRRVLDTHKRAPIHLIARR